MKSQANAEVCEVLHDANRQHERKTLYLFKSQVSTVICLAGVAFVLGAWTYSEISELKINS